MGKGLDKAFRGYAVLSIIVLNTLLLALAAEFGLGLVRELRQGAAGRGEVQLLDRRIIQPTYGDHPLSEELLQEISRSESSPDWSRFEPYSHWLTKPLAGRYINVDERGFRKTVGQVEPNARKILLFGGSTAFCAHAPDNLTIASLLQSKLGSAYQVVNMGQGGFVSTQEVNLLMRMLAQGERPYAVIFYDGVNDTFSGVYSPAVPRDPHGVRQEEQRRREQRLAQEHAAPLVSRLGALYRDSNVERFVQWVRHKQRDKATSFVGGKNIEVWEKGIEGDIDRNAELTVRYYLANIDAVWALSRQYGFHPFFFWQPNILTLGRPMTAAEEGILQTVRPVLQRCQRATDSLARKALSGMSAQRAYYIADVFDADPRPVYVDFCHVGPTGNDLVASRIHKHLQGSTLFGSRQ